MQQIIGYSVDTRKEEKMEKSKILLISIILISVIMVILVALIRINNKTKYMQDEYPKEGAVEFQMEELDKVTIRLLGLTMEMEENIKDKEDFKLRLKEYIYFHELLDATIAQIVECDTTYDNMTMKIQLNDVNSTTLKVVIDFETNTSRVTKFNK